MLGGGVADVGELPCPGDDREHGDGQGVGDREQAPGGAHGPSGRPARPGRPGGPSPPRSGLALLLCRGGGAAPVNAGSFTPGCLLNARAGDHRAAGDEGERLAPAGPGGTPLIYRNRVSGGLFHFLPWNQGPEGQRYTAVMGGPMYLGAPAMDLGRSSTGPGRARPPRGCGDGGGLRNRFTFTPGAGLGAEGVFVRHADAAPALAGSSALAALVRGGHADCRCRVLTRERCPANAPWRGRRLDRHREDVATYRDGFAGHALAGSRPAPADSRQSGSRDRDRGRSAELADRLQGLNCQDSHIGRLLGVSW